MESRLFQPQSYNALYSGDKGSFWKRLYFHVLTKIMGFFFKSFSVHIVQIYIYLNYQHMHTVIKTL